VSQGLAEQLLEAFFTVLEAPDCLPMHIAQCTQGLSMLHGFRLKPNDLRRLMERFNSFPDALVRHRDLSNVIAAVGALDSGDYSSSSRSSGGGSESGSGAMTQGLVGDFIAKMESAHPKEIIKVLRGFSQIQSAKKLDEDATQRVVKYIERLCSELYVKCTEGVTRHQVTYEDLASVVHSIAFLASSLAQFAGEEGKEDVHYQSILRTYRRLLDLYLDKISPRDPQNEQQSICLVMESLGRLGYWPSDSQVAHELVCRVTSRSQDHFNSGDIAWMISTLGAITITTTTTKEASSSSSFANKGSQARCLEDLYECFQSKRENATAEDIALVESTMANLL
jgi:hypothetical protein